MSNTLGQSPFNGMLPPLQPARVTAPYAPPVPPVARIDHTPIPSAEAPTAARVAPKRASLEEEPPIVDDHFT